MGVRSAGVELSDRSVGWLRYLHRKATTPDDWSRDGRPHPHWDDRSDPPMASWHRFDLVDSMSLDSGIVILSYRSKG